MGQQAARSSLPKWQYFNLYSGVAIVAVAPSKEDDTKSWHLMGNIYLKNFLDTFIKII